MRLIDYYTKQVLATVTSSKDVNKWAAGNGYLVHHKSGNKVILIK